MWSAIRFALCHRYRPLQIQPPDLVSVEALCASIGKQSSALLSYLSLYVFWAIPEAGRLDLRTLLTSPESLAPPAPSYAGLITDDCCSPIPLTLDLAALPDGPHVWSAGGEFWLDLPVGRWLLLRFRLVAGHIPGPAVLKRLARWAQRSAPVLEAAGRAVIRT